MKVKPWFPCMIQLFGYVSLAPIKMLEQHERKGTEQCRQVSTLVVNQGATQAVAVSTDKIILKVSKYNPQTAHSEELFLFSEARIHPLTNKKSSISLDNKNFTVKNATKADEGLYTVTSHLNGTCFTKINVTVVLDSPLPVPTTSPSVTPKIHFLPSSDSTLPVSTISPSVTPNIPFLASSNETVIPTIWSITGPFTVCAVFVAAAIVIICVVQNY